MNLYPQKPEYSFLSYFYFVECTGFAM